MPLTTILPSAYRHVDGNFKVDAYFAEHVNLFGTSYCRSISGGAAKVDSRHGPRHTPLKISAVTYRSLPFTWLHMLYHLISWPWVLFPWFCNWPVFILTPVFWTSAVHPFAYSIPVPGPRLLPPFGPFTSSGFIIMFPITTSGLISHLITFHRVSIIHKPCHWFLIVRPCPDLHESCPDGRGSAITCNAREPHLVFL